MKRMGIFGTSGFAREVADVAEANDYAPLFIARSAEERDAWGFDREIILESELSNFSDIGFALGIGENAARQRVAERHGTLRFVSLMHPSASFGRGQREAIAAQTGVVVCAGVRFTNNIRVGRFSIFNLNVTVGHDVEVGAFVNVSPGANVSGNVAIGAHCWIGTGAAVNQGSTSRKLTIGEGTVIGAGSVVVKDCDAESVYVGVPARKVK